MQLDQARSLDLLAQELCRSPLTDRARICSRLTPRLAQESTARAHPSQPPGHGFRNELEIRHILNDGKLESHSDAESRLLAEERVPAEDFFISREELIARAYDRRGAKIAFHESGEPADFSGVGK